MSMSATVTPLRWRPEVEFDTRLRLIRNNLGERERGHRYTQAEFAELLGVKPGTYKTWEAGGDPEDIVGIAKLIEQRCNVPAAWTLGVEEPTESGPDDPGEQVNQAAPWETDSDESDNVFAINPLQPVALRPTGT